MLSLKHAIMRRLGGLATPGLTETRLLNDFSEFLMMCCGLIGRMPEEMRKDLNAPDCRADVLVERFMDLTQGEARVHVWMALSMLIGAAVEEWKDEEKLLSGPVQ